MNAHKEYPDWFLWMLEKGVIFFIGGACLLATAVLLFAIYLDHRIDQVESRQSFVPPRSYEIPNLADYSVGNTEMATLAVRQWVYVPIYSHVYYQGGSPYSLEATLSIRNTDCNAPLYIMLIEYFDTAGNSLKKYLDRPIRLSPLQSIEFLVESRDSSGGAGANFLIEWRAASPIDKPLMEAVMVGTSGSKAIAFERSGIEISGPRSE